MAKMRRWVRVVSRFLFECAAGALAGYASAVAFTVFFFTVCHGRKPEYGEIRGLAQLFGIVGTCVGAVIGFIFWAVRCIRAAEAARIDRLVKRQTDANSSHPVSIRHK